MKGYMAFAEKFTTADGFLVYTTQVEDEKGGWYWSVKVDTGKGTMESMLYGGVNDMKRARKRLLQTARGK